MKNRTEDVRSFYNTYNEQFISVYGNIIQAFRTKDVELYLTYTAQSIGFKDGDIALDAGCGIAGPAMFFANNNTQLTIEACTVSEQQLARAQQLISKNKLQKQIKCSLLDYHKINTHFGHDHFNVIYFLESFGHSTQQEQLLAECWDCLKEEGVLYIKDLFRKEYEDEWMQLRSDEIVESINRAYKYSVPELNKIVSCLRRKGFIIDFIRSPEINKEDFEHLSISNEFQNIFDVDKIEGWDDYIFPIDFYEIRAIKPKNFRKDMHLHHLNK